MNLASYLLEEVPVLNTLIEFIVFEDYQSEYTLGDLKDIIQQYYPARAKRVYRGTKIAYSHSALEKLLRRQPFTLTQDRYYRSWSILKDAAYPFASPQFTDTPAIGLLLMDTSSPDDTVIDLTDERVVESLRQAQDYVHDIYDGELPNELKQDPYELWENLNLLFRNIEKEQEIIREVNKTKKYTFGSNIQDVILSPNRMNDAASHDLVIELLRDNYEAGMYKKHHSQMVFLHLVLDSTGSLMFGDEEYRT